MRSPSLLLAAVSIILATGTIAADPRPSGVAGPEAEAFAQRLVSAVDGEAWDRTGAVRWTFRGDREHLWDRERSFTRVRWKKVEVLLDLTTRDGLAWKKGEPVQGDARTDLVEEAWKAWVNDGFWLNPVVKIFDDGTARSVVPLEDGGEGLLVEYASGGVTPGDAYLWIIGDDGLPEAWRMWVSNIPIGGARASWEGWITLATGARIATEHDLALGRVDLEDVAGAGTLAELEPGPDPFAPLVASETR